MSESKRIKDDYEHFLRTGDDYPHIQRHYDKKAIDKLLCAAVWCACVAVALLVWMVAL